MKAHYKNIYKSIGVTIMIDWTEVVAVIGIAASLVMVVYGLVML